MHCLQVYLPPKVSYIGFGVFSMHPPVVLASLFFFFRNFSFSLFPRKQSTLVNYRDGERRGLDVGVTPATLP